MKSLHLLKGSFSEKSLFTFLEIHGRDTDLVSVEGSSLGMGTTLK